jgi:two-component system chemotaxis response regulator CheB
MVCDDSAVIRGLIARTLDGDPDIHVVTTVANGQMAINSLSKYNVEVCILDIEMPVMDGLTALPKMIELQPDLQVIMASTLTRRNAEISLRALADGAADYLAKPTTTIQGGTDFKIELVSKVKALAAVRRRIAGIPRPQSAPPAHQTPSTNYTLPSEPVGRTAPSVYTPAPTSRAVPPAPGHAPERAPAAPAARPLITPRPAMPLSTAPKAPISLRPAATETPEVIAIGSSTGGPQALFSMLTALGKNLAQPIVITQHMPATFTTILAEHIERASGIPTVEAADGMVIQGGRAYVAPGDYHLTIEAQGAQRVARLLKTPPENYCRPSVDPMLRSLVKLYGRRILVVILTGMGHDGLKGSEAVAAAGGTIVAQDEATSVVWGMPGAVATAGVCSAVLPLTEIAPHVRRMLGRAA